MATNRRTTSRARGTVRSSAARVTPGNLSVVGPTDEVRPSRAVDWVRDYAYVYRDVRELAIVSGAIMAVMLVIGYLM